MVNKLVSIIDYGMGNVGSVSNMLKKIGVVTNIINDPVKIKQADKLILPGVGAFDTAVTKLVMGKWIDPISQHVRKYHKPILGICLGMQLFTRSSEEGNKKGLGFVDAETVRFNSEILAAQNKRNPQMGWNTINVKKGSVIIDNESEEQRFYFVHSYHVKCDVENDVLSTTHYGYEFVSSFEKNNIIGMQFHPEKSHKYGFKVLKRFAEEFNG